MAISTLSRVSERLNGPSDSLGGRLAHDPKGVLLIHLILQDLDRVVKALGNMKTVRYQ